jgi:hypothetical protein
MLDREIQGYSDKDARGEMREGSDRNDSARLESQTGQNFDKPACKRSMAPQRFVLFSTADASRETASRNSQYTPLPPSLFAIDVPRSRPALDKSSLFVLS